MFVMEENRAGKFIKVGVKGKGSSRWIYVPEIASEVGWDMVAGKIMRFVSKVRSEKVKLPRTYKEVATIPPWPDLSAISSIPTKNSDMDFVVEEESCLETLRFLENCLVGRVGNPDSPNPPRSEVQKWVDKRWKTAGGVRVAEMGGKFFLFEFPSKAEANRFLKEKEWSVNQMPLYLERWDPVVGCHCEGRTPREVWVRALGLPFHLWGMSVFQKIGDMCGGFLGIDGATESRFDMRWARILVRYSSSLPARVHIGVRNRAFEITIWAESTAICRMRNKGGAAHNSGGILGMIGDVL